MLRGLVLALAVAGGNLTVTTSPHPTVWRWVRVSVTGQVDDRGRLFMYRNRGLRCGATQADEESRLGEGGRVVRIHAPVDVQGDFDLETAYLPPRFGVREWLCSYLYSPTCVPGEGCFLATRLPPNAGFAENRLDVRFALPPGGRWTGRRGGVTAMRAVSADTTRVTGSCGGRRWLIPSLPVHGDGSFAYAGVRGRFVRVSAVRGRVTRPGCGSHAFRLTGGAPRPPVPKGFRQ